MSNHGTPITSRSRSREASQENLANRHDLDSDSSLHGNQTSSGTPTVRRRIGVDVRDSRERSVTPGLDQQAEELVQNASRTRSGVIYEPIRTSATSGTAYHQQQNTLSGTPGGSASSSMQVQSPSRDRTDAVTNSSESEAPSKLHSVVNYVDGTPYLKILLFFITLLVVAIVGSIVSGNLCIFESTEKITQTKNIWTEKRSEVKKILKELHDKTFPNQARETFQLIYALVEGSLKRVEPVQPSAIAVLIPPDMHKSSFPLCFTRKLANAINRVFEPRNSRRARGLNLKHFASTKNVTLLHEDLKDYFDGGGRAVVVEDVEKLDEESHLFLFHSFCDNSRAYQKRAIFFFLLPVPQNIFENYEWNFRQGGHISDDILDKAWTKVLTPDKRPALISRIAASSVLLNPGDTCVVSE